MTDKVNLAEKLRMFDDLWSPKVIGFVNDTEIKLVKVKGTFIWHQHPGEDEFFLVLRGRLTVHLRERDVILEPGEFFVVPRDTEHQPEAAEEAHVLVVERKGVVNTGTERNERTIAEPERI